MEHINKTFVNVYSMGFVVNEILKKSLILIPHEKYSPRIGLVSCLCYDDFHKNQSLKLPSVIYSPPCPMD